jgi:hypothetical protein
MKISDALKRYRITRRYVRQWQKYQRSRAKARRHRRMRRLNRKQLSWLAPAILLPLLVVMLVTQ